MDQLSLINLGYAVLGALIVNWLTKSSQMLGMYGVQFDIRSASSERRQLDGIKQSDSEMYRYSFHAFCTLSLLFGAANLLPRMIDFINSGAQSEFSNSIEMFMWMLVVGQSMRYWRLYNDLKNPDQAIKKLDEKLEKLQSKLNKKNK